MEGEFKKNIKSLTAYSTLLCSFVLLPGIISMVIVTVLCLMVFVIRHMFQHKGSYHTNEAKGAESADCADAAIIVNDPAFTETIDESKKEWFIWIPLRSLDK